MLRYTFIVHEVLGEKFHISEEAMPIKQFVVMKVGNNHVLRVPHDVNDLKKKSIKSESFQFVYNSAY